MGRMTRIPLRWPLLIGGLIGLIGALGLVVGVFDAWGDRITDRFFLPRSADSSVAIVAIDDASLSKIGRWPWPRTVHAQLIQKLTALGAKAIALDVNFPEPSNDSDDHALAAAIQASNNVVLPIELSFVSNGGDRTFDSKNTVQPIAIIQSAAKAAGFSNTPLDADSIVRRVPLTGQGLDGSHVPSFSYETARLMGRAPELKDIPRDRQGNLLVNFPDQPRRAFPIIAASDILQDKIQPSEIQGKAIFIGATARDLHDQQNVATSYGDPMSGVEIHASIYDTLVSRAWLVPVSPWIQGLLVLLVGLILGFLAPTVRPRWSFLAALSMWIAWLLSAFILFDRGHVLDIVWITFVIFFGYASLILERWLATETQRRQLRSAFSRYVSPSVVEHLIREPDKLKLGGERRVMSVLFSDLRGFTSLSEGLTPEALVDVLNTYLNEMTNIVFEEGGVLDKYIGDAVMAFWNAPFDQKDHAARSVRTAIRMRDKLDEMNREGVFPKGVELKVGVGINSGDMVVGNIGADIRYDYTVIGDSVNLASRTEGLCKEYGVLIIITKNVLDKLGTSFVTRELDSVAVKGKKEPVRIFEVLGEEGKVAADKISFAKKFEQALNDYYVRKFDEAAKACESLLALKSDDVSTKNLLERCRIYLETPPPADWNGAWVMTKK